MHYLNSNFKRMKKKFILLSMALLTGFVFTGCKDDADEEVQYANSTVEENKQKIEDEGIAMVEKLDGMKGMAGIKAVLDLEALLSTQEEEASAALRILAPIAGAKKDVLSLSSMRSGLFGLQSLKTAFDSTGGVYTYNATTGKFTRTTISTDQITYIFPLDSSATNNGQITINNYTYNTAKIILLKGSELLKTLDVKVKKGTTTLMSAEIDAAYTSEDLPSSESVKFTFSEGYGFNQSFSYNSSSVGLNMAFTYNGGKIAQASFSTSGNYSFLQLLSLSQVETVEELNDYLKTANTSIQLGNIKLTGNVDYTSFYNVYAEAFPEVEPSFYSKVDMDTLCFMLNRNASMILMYASENSAIAMSDFYTIEKEKEVYNSTTQQYNTVTKYEPSMKFVFKDSTSLDKTFINEGFEDFLTAYKLFLAEMQSSYGLLKKY